MGSTNIGQQVISFDYNSAAQSDLINKTLHKTIPLGVKTGLTLSKTSSTEVSVLPGVMIIEDPTASVSVRVETQINVVVSVLPQSPYIVAHYRWSDGGNNYADFYGRSLADIVDGDVILGKAQWFDGTLLSTFDLNLRGQSVSPVSSVKIVATEPASDKVTLLSGSFWFNKQYFSFSAPELSPAFPATALTSRTDLLCLDNSGSLVVTPYIGEYPSLLMPLAKITRAAGHTTVEHDEIEILTCDRTYVGGIYGQFACGLHPDLSTGDAFAVGNGSSGSPADILRVGYDGDTEIQRDLSVGRNLSVTGGNISTSSGTLLVSQGGSGALKVTATKIVVGDNLDDTTGMRSHGLRISATEGATNPLFDIKNSGTQVLSVTKDYLEAPKLSIVSPRTRIGNIDTDSLYPSTPISGQLTITHVDSSDSTPALGSLFAVMEKLPSTPAKALIDFTSEHSGETRWQLDLNGVYLAMQRSTIDFDNTIVHNLFSDPTELSYESIYKTLVPGILTFRKWYYNTNAVQFSISVAQDLAQIRNSPGSYEIAVVYSHERNNWVSYPVPENRYIRLRQLGFDTTLYQWRFIPCGGKVGNAVVEQHII